MLRKLCQWIVRNIFRVQKDSPANQIELYKQAIREVAEETTNPRER